MSVLLEALKKAAEEKNKLAAKESEAESSPSEKDSLETTSSFSSEDVPGEVDQAPESTSSATATGETPVSETPVSLKLETSTPVEASGSRDLDELIQEPESAATATRANIYAAQDNNSSDDVELETRQQTPPATKLNFSIPTEEATDLESDKTTSEATANPEPSKSADFPVIDTTSLDEDALPEPDLAPVVNNDKTAPVETKATAKQADEPKVKEDKAEDDSFEWGLEQLPAYVPDGEAGQKEVPAGSASQEVTHNAEDDQKLAKNSVLTKNAHSKPYSTGGLLSSPKTLLALTSLTAFVCIGLYTAFYFDQQNQALEASFDKYKITPIQVELPKIPEQVDTESDKADGLSGDTVMADSTMDPALDEGQDTALVESLAADKAIASTKAVKPARDTTTKAAASSSTSKSSKAVATKSVPKAKTLRTTDKVLVLNTVNSTIIQPKPAAKAALITRSKALTPSQQQLVQGYEYYQRGEWQNAQDAFKAVSQRDPQNIKALIGLAATQNALGDPSTSVETYLQVLDIDPGNPFALEAVAEIANSVTAPTNDWLQQLTELAERNPKSAVLQNALGNFMARKQDWFKAQESYFNAVSIESNQAVYLMNLAISLDHLNKYKLAADYYTQALVYANNTTAIDQSAIKERLVILKQHSLMEP
ncbi:tetratricopeptide repeat protein [Thiomicrorhabdus xiamenensis]|uniref:Uncharacterized protein n=1 Tax=Thiomicrorhabdus xiamenensis TaxID=2739063 RepID=A0A7D4NQ98_9GAMM|nr:tetratricopeptide repeat protein [Thiomicrorhabdus xiamenensis]QKI88652.1 hypothetical protein HQN79_03240 [Thiomicrorhabdus xiamenensis]